MRAAILVLLAAAAIAATGASASPGLQLGITDSGDAYFADPGTFYPRLGELHSSLLRVHLNWGGKLGVAQRRPRDGADPADPAYDWSRYDRIVLNADAEGIHIVFSIFGTPRWANGGQLPTRAPRDASVLTDFAFAAAERYGGDYMREDGTVLPAVKQWTAWNEPNLPIGLVPQWKRVGGRWVIQSAIDYARICNAIVDGIHGTLLRGDVDVHRPGQHGAVVGGDAACLVRRAARVALHVAPESGKGRRDGPVDFEPVPLEVRHGETRLLVAVKFLQQKFQVFVSDSRCLTAWYQIPG